MPDISVLIPVYNRAAYIRNAIESVRAQQFAGRIEILVVDDGSTDATLAYAADIGDPRIRILEGDDNRGIASARNRGIAAAHGRYVAFLDSDDVARPGRLAAQHAFLERHREHAAVGGWIGWIDAQGQRLSRIKRKPCAYRLIAAERLFRSGIENSTAMARHEILTAYPHDETLVVGSDYDLWSRIARDHRMASLPRLLVDRRQHARQATAENVARDRHFRGRIHDRLLDELGVGHGPVDLDNHYRLRRLNKAGDRPDTAYLDWAEDWLTRLKTANRERGLYPEPEFSRLLAVFWAGACWHAESRGHGLARLSRSTLSPSLPAGAWQAWLQRHPLAGWMPARPPR